MAMFRNGTLRFIPAGAGNTGNGALLSKVDSVHPRGCGEHVGVIDDLVNTDGSSPRVRGTLTTELIKQWQWRFIPAGAGNTS